MRRLSIGLVLAAMALLLVPLPASAAEYETFVGCDDLAENPIPSHECQLGDFPGAFFESDIETELEVCVEFPNAEVLCTEEEPAEAEVLYVVSIFSELEGDHLVTWYANGVEVGSWVFRMDPPPSPPAPAPVVTPAPAPPAPPVVVSVPSTECLQAQKRVDRLKAQLRHAHRRKQKAKLRAKLRSARAAEKRLC
jgi:hypothetical protein